jgi:site-specific DNA recombinase
MSTFDYSTVENYTVRALIVARLSRVTDATTPPERQLQACRELCAQCGYEVAARA